MFMAEQATTELPVHGGNRLPSVEVDSYNLETKDDEGFLGDRVNKRAFNEIIEELRKRLRKTGEDPLGEQPDEKLSKKALDALIAKGSPEAAGVVQSAIEEYSQDLAYVIRRFLKLKDWRDTERVAIGGGMRGSRIGELVIGRAEIILRSEKVDIDLAPIQHDPDEAGLIGAAHLAPSWMFKGHDAILAVDVGGTNVRTGIVRLNLKRSPDLAKASVASFELWRHGDDEPTREDLIEWLVKALRKLIARAEKEDMRLTPFIGIGCPGVIDPDGSIERGAQNLPGKWAGGKFNLPARLLDEIPKIGEHRTTVLMHNDAVVQGLSQVPFTRDVTHWGVLTIGTGLGNARFTNRPDED
jgi:predicted NBD/HSP70 family sugar kinase